MKKLLHLYNIGHNPFPRIGKGGLGYHLPQYRLKGRGGILDEDGIIRDTGPETGDEIYNETGDTIIGRMNYDDMYNEFGEIDPDYEGVGIPEIFGHSSSKTNVKRSLYDEQPEKLFDDDYKPLNLQTYNDDDDDDDDYEDVTPDKADANDKIKIKNYIKSWSEAGTQKYRMTRELNSMFNFTNAQKDYIEKIKKSNLNKKKIDNWVDNETFILNEVEIIDDGTTEGYTPDYQTVTIDDEILQGIKSSELISDDNIGDVNSEPLNNLVSLQKSNNPFKTFFGDETYNNLGKEYDESFVNELLYDTKSGDYDSGKDLEDKVMKNLNLIKEILISTYGKDRLNLGSIMIDYDAEESKGNLFTVFDAHAVSFKLDGKPKEAFIEFKKYANYAKDISDTERLLENESIKFNNFVYTKMRYISILNDELALLKEKNKTEKEIKKKKEELNIELNKFNKSNRNELIKEFYLNLDPVSIGVKYTKFPPMRNFQRSETSINDELAYKYMTAYEKNTSRRNEGNIKAHTKASKENIDILIVTGLKQSLVVGNVTDLINYFGGKDPIEFLKLKKTVYGTKQKGKTTIDYDHYNIPFSFFRNVKLNPKVNVFTEENVSIWKSLPKVEQISNLMHDVRYNRPLPQKIKKIENEDEILIKAGLKEPPQPKKKKPKKEPKSKKEPKPKIKKVVTKKVKNIIM